MDSYVSYKWVENRKFVKYFDPKTIEYALRYEAKPDDKFVVTYPKSGTTWTQQIMHLIANEGVMDNLFPFPRHSYLEFRGENTIKEPAIKTHLPFEDLPKNSSAKYLLVFRNPKDSCVSYYYHTIKTDPDFKWDFHYFFQLWIRGQVPYGDYFDHTLQYWKHRTDKNFQFLVYEEIKRNPREAVLKIARFMGQNFVDKLSHDEDLVNRIINKSTIDSLRTGLEVNNLQILQFLTRKGEVGDWRNHMTEEESRRVDEKVEEVFGDTELRTLWTTDMN